MFWCELTTTVNPRPSVRLPDRTLTLRPYRTAHLQNRPKKVAIRLSGWTSLEGMPGKGLRPTCIARPKRGWIPGLRTKPGKPWPHRGLRTIPGRVDRKGRPGGPAEMTPSAPRPCPGSGRPGRAICPRQLYQWTANQLCA